MIRAFLAFFILTSTTTSYGLCTTSLERIIKEKSTTMIHMFKRKNKAPTFCNRIMSLDYLAQLNLEAYSEIIGSASDFDLSEKAEIRSLYFVDLGKATVIQKRLQMIANKDIGRRLALLASMNKIEAIVIDSEFSIDRQIQFRASKIDEYDFRSQVDRVLKLLALQASLSLYFGKKVRICNEIREHNNLTSLLSKIKNSQVYDMVHADDEIGTLMLCNENLFESNGYRMGLSADSVLVLDVEDDANYGYPPALEFD